MTYNCCKPKAMKCILSFILFFALSINLIGQNDSLLKSLYDYIGRDEIYILKTGSDLKSSFKIKVSDLRSTKAAEQLFGSNYTIKKFPEFLFQAASTQIKFNDGLVLNIPEYPKSLIIFHITSDKYTLFLITGSAIKVGMKADELAAIFPKSFSNRKLITDREDWNDKATFNVYFSLIINGKLVIEPSCIVFVLSAKNGVLEQIISWMPD